MKCILLLNGVVWRTSNENAEKLVKEGKADYIAKKFWKERGRQR